MIESDNSDPQRSSLENYKFSPEELQVLRECTRESFFQRSLPLGTGLGLSTYFAVQKGLLQPNAKYGSIPKVFVSVLVGYFAGKLSYQRQCAEKIMQLPNSKLAEILRVRSGRVTENSIQFKTDMPPAQFIPNEIDVYSDEYASNTSPSLDLGLEIKGDMLDIGDIYTPYLDDSQLDADVNTKASKEEVTSTALRNRNEYRKRYLRQRNQSLHKEMNSTQTESSTLDNEFENKPAVSKNKYGDFWNN